MSKAESPARGPKTIETMEQMLGEKVIHLARFLNDKGDVSPWCAATPRKINLKKESWTNRPEAANCFVCLNAFNDGKHGPENGAASAANPAPEAT